MDLNLEDSFELYNALQRQGFVTDIVAYPGFLLRPSTKQAVKRFQTSIGAVATGYLTEKQIAALRTDQVRPLPEKSGPDAARRIEIELEKLDPFQAWRQAGYSVPQKATIYRALYNRRFINDSAISTKFATATLQAAVKRYQASIGVRRTGFLTRSQVSELLADPGDLTPWQRHPDLKRDLRQKLFSEGGFEEYGRQWTELNLSRQTKTELYRALYQRRYINDPKPVADFMNRLELIQAVAYFQKDRDLPVTGFLTEVEVKILLRRKADPTPYEAQEAVLERFSATAVTEYVSQLAAQEFITESSSAKGRADDSEQFSIPIRGEVAENRLEIWNELSRWSRDSFGEKDTFKVEVLTLQWLLEVPTTGYITIELIERSKMLSLRPALGQVRSQLHVVRPRFIASVKDWNSWKIDDFDKCEIGTSAIELEGFLGNIEAPSLHFFRDSDWSRNQVNWRLQLTNWDKDKIATAKVAGRLFHLTANSTDVFFADAGGNKLSDESEAYNDFINAVARANGFEIRYVTVFGSEVTAGFSAMGFTKQFRALRSKC